MKKQTQYKPNLSRRPVRRSFSEDGSLWRSRIKPNFYSKNQCNPSGASLHFGLSFSVSYGQSLPVLQLYRLAKIRGFISYSSTLFAKVLWLCNKFSIHLRVTLLNAKANQETEVLIVSAMR
jgi:hypothetical protein